MNQKDPALYYRVDIGYGHEGDDRKIKLAQRLEHRKTIKDNFDLQKAARNRTCKLREGS